MVKKKIFCFDIDNTICKTIGNDYLKSIPIKKAVQVINLLYENGYEVKLYTSRYMGRSQDNVSQAKKKGLNMLKKQLKSWKIKYNSLHMGKPSFDLLIDDKSIFFKKNWPSFLIKNFLSKINTK